jgi:multicomponent Na+:H+ antiporter subunit C
MHIERAMLLLMFLIGFHGVANHPHVIKKVMALGILNSSVIILFVLEGSRIGTNAPIMDAGTTHVVDPMPQALMLTAIVIGVCITALALAFACLLHKWTGSFDINEIRKQVMHHE